MQETQETWIQSLVQENILEEGMQLISMFFPGESHGQKSLVGYIHRVAKSDMTEATEHTCMHAHGNQ